MPRQPEPSWRDGIRSIHPDEFEQLDALLSAVFRPSLVEEYTHFYTRENAGNFRVVVADGQVVSHIGTLRRYVSIFGCTVRVASLGGVATYEAHRGKGYATALLEDTERFCRADGVDFMLVSGYRKMYHRYGCRYVGRDWTYTVTAEQAGVFEDGGLEIVAATPEDLPALAAVYRREPVRWIRPPSDFEYALAGFVMNRPARVLAVRERGMLRGYVILQLAREQDQGRVQVLEFAGDRICLVGMLGRLVRDYELSALDLHVMGCDRLLQDLLQERGLKGVPANASGTATLIHFSRFMERMRPYFAEVVGETAAEGLVFQERGDEMLFTFGGDRVIAPDRGAAVQLIFGTLDGAEEELLKSGGQAGEILREIFPIPGLWYGLNYV